MQYLSVVPFLDKRGRMLYLVGGTVCCTTLEEAASFARGDLKSDYTRSIADNYESADSVVRMHWMRLSDVKAPNGVGSLDRFPWEVAA